MLADTKKKIGKQHKENIKNIHDNFENSMLTIFKQQLGMNEDEYRAINFISMLIYNCERSIEKTCKHIIKKGVIVPLASGMIDFMFEELTFTSKINIYEELLKKDPIGYKDLINGVSYYRQLNTMRNQIFHCKLNNVLYKGKSIMEGETKLLLVNGWIAACGLDSKKNVSRRVLASEEFNKK